jgi:hypothetical protein
MEATPALPHAGHPLLQGFYSVHGDAANTIARQFYKTTAVVKYLGNPQTGLPGSKLLSPAQGQLRAPMGVNCPACLAHRDNHLINARKENMSHSLCHCTGGDAHACRRAPAGVTLSRNLYEAVLRSLLLERAEHSVELYEGAAASWTCTK